VIPATRPLVVAIAGPNGAGKSTFYEAFFSSSGFRFLNADVIARELQLEAYPAAKVAARLREELVSRNESFIFETVLSDPVGDKVDQLVRWQDQGYTVVLCFVGLADASLSDQRVAMRVTQGGHDVPANKITERFPRVLANLRRALGKLGHVYVFDHSDFRNPYRRIAVYENGTPIEIASPLPAWFSNVSEPKKSRGKKRR
jgi:predicted ABC-type ATPase